MMETDNSTDTLSDEGTIPAADETALDEQELTEYLAETPDTKSDNTGSAAKCDTGNKPNDIEKTDTAGPSEWFSQVGDESKSPAAVAEEQITKDVEIQESVAMDTTDADDEDSSFNQSCSSSVSSTPVKHLEPPTPHPVGQSTQKTLRDTRASGGACKASKFPQRPGIVWREGAKLEARDFQEKWYSAKILEMDASDDTILVHFEGWNSRFDEWLPVDSERIRCVTRHSERKETRSKSTSRAEHKIGECVFAKWTDCRMYPGKIVAVTSAGNYDVLFYDGFKKTVVPINVKTMPEDVQQEYAKAGLLPEVGKKNKFPIKELAKEIQEKQKIKSPECTRRSRTDSDRRSSFEKDRSEVKREVKKEESWDAKSTTEKRRKSADNPQQAVKKQKVETKEEPKEKKERRESLKEENKDTKSTKPSKEKTTSPESDDTDVDSPFTVGKKCEKTTPKSMGRSSVLPGDTLTTEPPSEEYSCPFEPCTKSFRKKSLVEYHVKYYHTDDMGTPVQQQVQHRKRKNTAGSEDGDGSTSASHPRSRKRREVRRSSLEFVSHQQHQTVALHEDALSEDTKTSTTEDYQQEVFQHSDGEDQSDGGVVDRIEKDEVVNCICQINEENGLMIQCDVCLCWQHAVCMEITEETLPAKYVCYVCANPPGVRESGKYIYDQDWIKLGTMHKFSFLPEDRHAQKKARIMEATHALVGDLLGVRSVLNASKRKLSVVRNPDSSELSIWKEVLDPSSEPVKTQAKDNSDSASIVSQSETGQSEILTTQNGKGIDDKSKTETVVCETKNETETKGNEVNNGTETEVNEVKSETETKVNEVRIKTETKVGDVKHNSESEVCEVTMKSRNLSVDGGEGGAAADQLMEGDHMENDRGSTEANDEGLSAKTNEVKTEAVNGFEACSLHLLQHISGVHDNIEQRLELIEQQVMELEAVEEGKNSSILKDVPKVKKSMHHLINDLYKVKRLSMYN